MAENGRQCQDGIVEIVQNGSTVGQQKSRFERKNMFVKRGEYQPKGWSGALIGPVLVQHDITLFQELKERDLEEYLIVNVGPMTTT
jgi:hypothetical protein